MTIVPTAMNGKYPAAFLATLPGVNGNGTPHLADRLAVESYGRLRRDFEAAGLGALLPTPGWSCYRSLDDQAYMRSIGATTIPVGKSIHGEALAVDLQGIPFGSVRHEWLKANAGRYGWYQPGWAKVNGSLPESWHWEYDARGDTAPGPSTDAGVDDMAEAQVLAAIAGVQATVNNIESIIAGGTTGGMRGQLTALQTAVGATRADVGTVANEVRADKAVDDATKTNTDLLKGGVATIIDLLNGGAAAKPEAPTDGAGPVALTEADLDAIADRVAARLFNGPTTEA